jgi:hypothetical protein
MRLYRKSSFSIVAQCISDQNVGTYPYSLDSMTLMREKGVLFVGKDFRTWCCARDEGWPFGVALRWEASNHHMLRWLKTVVVSDVEKAHMMRQVGTGKTVCSPRGGIAVDVS